MAKVVSSLTSALAKHKLRKYIILKEIFAISNYVSTLLPKPHRSIFAQFCCGILPLRVETGR